jgi:hypothetical protein
MSPGKTEIAPSARRWRFFRAGGFDQVKIETGADLAALDQLDLKLWVALACPISSIEFDPKTAALLDLDKDGRIRASELIAAVKWACSVLKDPDDIIKGGSLVRLDGINEENPDGQQIRAAAQRILAHLNRPNDPAISLEDASDAKKIFADTILNGDGVIIVESAADEPTRLLIQEVIDCQGTVPDQSGKLGVDQAKVDAFFADCVAFEAWMSLADREAATVLPAGQATAEAALAVEAVEAKINDFFGRCRLIEFDPRVGPFANRSEVDYAVILAKDVSLTVLEVAGFPLAQAAPGKPLPLAGPVNPAHMAALAKFRDAAVRPLVGERTELAEAEWLDLRARLAPYSAWKAAKPVVTVEKLGINRVREILAGPGRAALETLIAQDRALELQGAAIANVEKLARYVRDLRALCLNFVNFKDLYSGDATALFQVGTLYLDQRSCHLCLTVEDAGRHATMAGLAGAFLAYVDCVRKGSGEKLSIVAIFSQGDDDNLMVGRNGVFYDRKGRDFDATITKIVANPISLRQSFWAPYKKLVRMIEEQVAKRAAVADADANAQLSAFVSVASAGGPAPAKKTAFDPSVIALLSVALGSLAAAFAAVLTFLGKFAPWQLPLALGGIMLVVSAPSLLLAFSKLRKRNLGPILDANGWAINAKARINVPFGTSLTDIAKLPPGSSVDIHDRYAEKTAAWPKFLVTIFFVWWIYAFIDDTGILYRLTSDWEVPFGKPPAALRPRQEPAKTNAPPATARAATAEAPAPPKPSTNGPPAAIPPK